MDLIKMKNKLIPGGIYTVFNCNKFFIFIGETKKHKFSFFEIYEEVDNRQTVLNKVDRLILHKNNPYNIHGISKYNKSKNFLKNIDGYFGTIELYKLEQLEEAWQTKEKYFKDRILIP